MRRPAALLAWGALSSPAAAWLNNPFLKSLAEESWTPPTETGLPVAGDQDQLAMGFSPRPTEAPELYGRMELAERMAGYTLGTDTCGYIKDGNSFTCITAGATCTYSDDYIGCCDPSSDCNVVKTTCIDYDASFSGACDLPSDFHTLCCGTSAYGACYTYVVSTTGSGSDPDSTFTLLDCSATTGTSTLFDYDPAWALTHISSAEDSSVTSDATATDTSASDTSASGTATTSTAPATSTASKKDGTPIGPIVGGVVGGVAVIALIGVAIFFFLRKKKAKQAAPAAAGNLAPPPVQPQQPMTQNPQSPQSFAPTSPAQTAYTSGVPPSFQGYPPQQGTPQPYDPHMSAYGSQPAYSPQPGYNAAYAPPGQFPPQHGFDQQQGQYPPQQGFDQQQTYSQYGAVPGYQPPSSASPPPNLTPSPGPKEGEAVFGGQQQQQQPPYQQHQQQQAPHNAMELPAINPVGNETNRAELG